MSVQRLWDFTTNCPKTERNPILDPPWSKTHCDPVMYTTHYRVFPTIVDLAVQESSTKSLVSGSESRVVKLREKLQDTDQSRLISTFRFDLKRDRYPSVQNCPEVDNPSVSNKFLDFFEPLIDRSLYVDVQTWV